MPHERPGRMGRWMESRVPKLCRPKMGAVGAEGPGMGASGELWAPRSVVRARRCVREVRVFVSVHLHGECVCVWEVGVCVLTWVCLWVLVWTCVHMWVRLCVNVCVVMGVCSCVCRLAWACVCRCDSGVWVHVFVK